MAKKVAGKAEKSTPPKPGRNPPKASQFKKGVSGNPKGRPPGSKNLRTIFEEAAADQVIATIGGKPRKISKLQAAVMQLATKAAGGDPKSMGQFLEWFDDMEKRASTARPTQFPFGELDLEVLHATYARMKQCSREVSD